MSPEMNNIYEFLCKDVNKKYGAGTIFKLTESPMFSPKDVIPTGSIALNTALGIGGYPKGKIVEVYGPESSGKTTLTLEAAVQAQKDGGEILFIDAEHALDVRYAQSLGIDLNRFAICQPTTAEEALDIADMGVKSGMFSMVIVDSVAALVPQVELEGEMSDANVGIMSRLMSKAMRKLVGNCHRTNTCMIWINQIRMKIGVMFGSPETTCVHPNTKIELVIE